MSKLLSDQVAEGIRKDIMIGKLKGNTFLVESEVAEQYSVSKAPVKAALQSLTQEGLLICYPRRGYLVTSISVDEYRYVRELRAHIERFSVKVAIQRASDEEIKSLASKDEPSERCFYSNNIRFHLRLAEITHNPYLSEIVQKLLLLTQRYASQRSTDNFYHDQIIEALLKRDEPEALRLLDKDLNPDNE